MEAPLKYKLIYVFGISDKEHIDCLKVGETTFEAADGIDKLTPGCETLTKAAQKRINQYTSTAGIAYNLLHTEIACYKNNSGKIKGFSDYDVHNVLTRSGIKKKKFEGVKSASEWFETDLQTIKNAITAVKQGHSSLKVEETSDKTVQIIFRPEQEEAIDKTKKRFEKKSGDKMLWNAKMRFGKTLTALELIKRTGYRRSLILTHRPVVDGGWFEDFKKIFNDCGGNVKYGSKDNGEKHHDLEAKAKNTDYFKYIYFASLQDLRGSKIVGGDYEKNEEIYNTIWDLVIIDEAHEGTQTDLGQAVLKEVVKKGYTKTLHLSGTPFNLMDDFKENEVYTWDYVMEQRAKRDWDLKHFGEPNPYAGLPQMHIHTYNIGKEFKAQYGDEELSFNFAEFFRVNTDGTFVHSQDIKHFLDLLVNQNSKDDESNYPFASEQYRNMFRHTLWMVPGVKAALALSKLLKEHSVFSCFNIVNVAGEGDEETTVKDPLKMVKDAIGDNPDETWSITLSCGRLTTGVTVPEWTAVLMLAGSYSTMMSSYMQTIFRVQSPSTINGRMKTDCHVFDFAPDRVLKIVTEVATTSAACRNGNKNGDGNNVAISEFLNFCPVIAIDGSNMKPLDANDMMVQIKRIRIERAVSSGFEYGGLYNEKLYDLDAGDWKELEDLKKIIGQTKAIHVPNEVSVNEQGFAGGATAGGDDIIDDEEHEGGGSANEPDEEYKKRQEKKKKRETAISILRGISIRMPLILYGADIENEDKEITLDNFADLIDAKSWKEFMPKGVTRKKFNAVKKYYDADVFRGAGKRIRAIARSADTETVEERIETLASIFHTFRNPDKETVLTPWRVVNMHLGESLGGYVFYENNDEGEYKRRITEPLYKKIDGITNEVFNPDSHILEINSKSGLYALYATYSIYRSRVENNLLPPPKSVEEEHAVWDKVLLDNIFVVCKTKMAENITRRTLAGFRNVKVNAETFDNLIDTIRDNPGKFIAKVKNGKSFWKSNNTKNMKINAVVGNPPYQLTTENTSDTPVYNYFMDAAFEISDKVTLITPARYLFNAGKTPKEWNQKILNDEHFKVVWQKTKSTDVFPNVDIKGGVAVIYRDANKNFGKIGAYTAYPELNDIVKKVVSENEIFTSLSDIIYPQNKFDLKKLYAAYPKIEGKIGSDGKEKRLTTSIFSLSEIFTHEAQNKTDIKIIGLIDNNVRDFRYINAEYIAPHPNTNKYKVLVPKSNGSGAIGEVLSTPLIGEPLIGEPLIGYTQSFIGIGAFLGKQEAKNALKYVRTKFARCMLGVLKVTQDNSKDTWRFVPLQDFTDKSDIDWSKSVAEIDRQLYKKYNLTPEEITFIEEKIRPME